MKKVISALLVGLLLVLIYLAVDWIWPSLDGEGSQPAEDKATAELIDNTRPMAKPGTGGFYQIEWRCQSHHQLLSFRILTAGLGQLEVVIETINPNTRPHTVARVLSESVYVDDHNRPEVESRQFLATVPAGYGVHIGLIGQGGAATSQDRTLTPLNC